MNERLISRRSALKGIAMLSFCAAGMSLGCAQGNGQSGASGKTDEPKVQVQSVGPFEVTLLNARMMSVPGDVMSYLSGEGKAPIAVKFSVKNTSSSQAVISLFDFSASVDGSAQMEPSLFWVDQIVQLNGWLAQGESITGEVGFDIPKDWKTMKVTLSSGGQKGSFQFDRWF